MVNVDYDKQFKEVFSKIDKSIREKVDKAITKIINNPEIGKPMRFSRKGTREIYVSQFRLSYAFIEEENKIIFLELYHKDGQ